MKTVTIRDLRQRWPETEKALQSEDEIVITRDTKPVARLLRYVDTAKTVRPRFDPLAQKLWLEKNSGGATVNWVNEHLLTERDER